MCVEENMAEEDGSSLVISRTSVLFSWHVLDVSVLLAFCCMVQRERERMKVAESQTGIYHFIIVSFSEFACDW
jgi:hypothetical protein